MFAKSFLLIIAIFTVTAAATCSPVFAYDFSKADGEPLEQLWQGHMQEDSETATAALSWLRGTSTEADPKLSEFKIGEYLQKYPDPDPASDPGYSPQNQVFVPTNPPQVVRPPAKTCAKLLLEGYRLRGYWHAYLLKYFEAASRRRDTTKNEFKDRLLSLCGDEAVAKALSGITTDNISSLINSSQSIVQDIQNILIVLDNSHSMGRSRGDKTTGKEQACSLIKQILAAMPESISCGMRTFGGSIERNTAVQWRDSILVFPPVVGRKKNQILDIAQRLVPNGSSPLYYALREAIIKDLSDCRGNSAILLISDGQIDGIIPSRGGYSKLFKISQHPIPPILAFKLEALRGDIENTIAMQALANITKGKYYDKDSLPDLINDLKSIGKKPEAETKKRHDN